MIHMDGFDVDAAHDWAIKNAQRQGCTCREEPGVGISNCEEHGIHMAHFHEKRCVLSFWADPRRPELIAAAELN